MSCYEILNLVITLFTGLSTLAVAIVSAAIAVHANKIQKDQLKLQAELQIKSLMNNAKNNYKAIKLYIKSNPSQKDNDITKISKENVANNCEEACMTYSCNKVDKANFKKMYKTQICDIVEDEGFRDMYTKPQTKYSSTVAVYEELSK